AGLILAVWVVGGLLTLAGALTYGELGGLFPKAGGIYHFLQEAYGPLVCFLYGWTAFLVIMSGGIAAIAVGFGEYLGAFFPFWSTQHLLASLPIGSYASTLFPFGSPHWSYVWTFSGGQLAAMLTTLLLTTINHFGVREGAWVQNLLTVLKIGAIAAFVL